MKLIGVLLAIVASILSIVAFIPLLGWLYWVVVPIGIIAWFISSAGNTGLGKTLSLLVIVIGICRLIIGGGVI